MPSELTGRLIRYGNNMFKIKAFFFLLFSTGLFIFVAYYNNWSILRGVIAVAFLILFSVAAFFLYRELYSDDD